MDTPQTSNSGQAVNLPNIKGFFYFFADIYKFGSSDTAQLLMTTIGGIVLMRGLFAVINWLFGVLQSPRLAIFRHAGNDSWAVVTGANDGLGRAFSEELLRRGFNVLLHGRNAQKLEKVKKELLEEWPKRQVDTVVADASKYDDAYATVVKKAKSLPGKVTILVNNVGGQITRPRFQVLSECKHEDLDTCINVNARFPTHLTATMLPLLQENKPSLIINSGSSGAVIGVPYMATYSATKAYIHTLCHSLYYEMIAQGTPEVEIKGFIIGNTETSGNPYDMPFFTLKPRECADSCLDRVGKAGGPLVYSHWRHSLQASVMAVMPQRFVEPQIVKIMKEREEAEMAQMGTVKKDN